jgi:hypothetical protein
MCFLLKTCVLNIIFAVIEELFLLIGKVKDLLVFAIILYWGVWSTFTGFINCTCNRGVVAIRLNVSCT